MPRLPRLSVAVLDALARELRFVPRETALRDIERVETLVREVDPAGVYPAEWVVFRVTGYRPEGSDGSVIAGSALLADLGPLVEHLCASARLGEADLPGDGWLPAPALAARWSVDRQTLLRYRRLGLVARRVIGPRGHVRLAYAPEIVAWFERTHGARLRRAAAFSRVDAALAERIVRRARRYRSRFGCSIGGVSERIAARFGRGRETVRQLLLRHDRDARARGLKGGQGPIFGAAPALRRSGRARRVIDRALRKGLGIALLARRYERSPARVHRAWLELRLDRLRELELGGPAPQVFGAPGAESAFLSPSSVRAGLGRPAPATLRQLLDEAEAEGWPDAGIERDRAAAYWYLRWWVREHSEAGPDGAPSAGLIDVCETRLRWAARLKAELVRSQVLSMCRAIEVRLGRSIGETPGDVAGSAVRRALSAVIEGVERHDPFRGGRLAAPVGVGVNRALSRWEAGEGAPYAAATRARTLAGATRATARPDLGRVRMADWSRAVASWQTWLEVDARVRAVLPQVNAVARDLLVLRQGWSGAEPPRSLREIGERLGVPARVVALRERRAVAEALRAARGPGAAPPA